MQGIRYSRWRGLIVFGAVGLLLAGCGPREPDEVVADPRAEAIAALEGAELRQWWDVYRDRSPARYAAIVDEVSGKAREGLPTTRRKLDRFLKSKVIPRYRDWMEESEEGKAFIRARAEERLANPPVARLEEGRWQCVVADLHVLPGTWKSTSRISEGMKDPEALGHSPYLEPEVLARVLRRLVDAFPDEPTYHVRYAFHAGSSLKRVWMQLSRRGPAVYRQGVKVKFTVEPLPWEGILAGTANLADLDWRQPMEGSPAPRLTPEPKGLLPLSSGG